MENSAFDFTVRAANGSPVDLSDYRGRVLLVVNTASKCGFTPQYESLEKLHQEYSERGLVVLGFPCNQFGAQEPGSAEEIASFCELNYGVTFPVLQKVSVNGSDAEPLFNFLKEGAPGFMGTSFIKWNFTKFLVDRDGQVVERFAPNADPMSMRSAIERLL